MNTLIKHSADIEPCLHGEGFLKISNKIYGYGKFYHTHWEFGGYDTF